MPLQLPAPRTTLHLYRHLLREASYLPPALQPFVSGRIKTQFHKHRDSPPIRSRLERAKVHLRKLRAAVVGDTRQLSALAYEAFGRVGARRRELLARLLVPTPPTDTASLEMALRQKKELDARQAPRDWLDKWDTAKLMALLQSQTCQAPHITGNQARVKPSTINPANYIPSTNIWGLPFAPKPLRTKQRHFYKRMANKALPPVGKGEWELLEALSKSSWTVTQAPAARRSVAAPVSAPPEQAHDQAAPQTADWDRDLRCQAWDMEAYLLHPTRWVDRKSSRKNVVRSGLPQPNDEFGHVRGVHTDRRITPRQMRRIFQRVWQETPVMEPRPERPGKWNVKWGLVQQQVSPASREHAVIFEGVDSSGAIKRSSPVRDGP